MKNYLLTYGVKDGYGRAKMTFSSPYTIVTGNEAYDIDKEGITIPSNDLYQNYFYPETKQFVESTKTDKELQGTVWAKKVQLTGALETEAVAFPNYYEEGTTLQESILKLNVPHLSENIFKYMNPNGVSVRGSDFNNEFDVDANTKLEAVSGNGCVYGETKIGPYKGTLKFNVALDFTKGQVEGLLHKIAFKSNAEKVNIFITNLSAQVATLVPENGYFVYTLPEPKLLSEIGQIRLLPFIPTVELGSNGEETLYVEELQGIGKTIHNEYVTKALSNYKAMSDGSVQTSTDNIAAGTETWILYCGDSESVMD